MVAKRKADGRAPKTQLGGMVTTLFALTAGMTFHRSLPTSFSGGPGSMITSLASGFLAIASRLEVENPQ
ncbi:hypothetical protein D3C80_2055200 [compost metagenome]